MDISLRAIVASFCLMFFATINSAYAVTEEDRKAAWDVADKAAVEGPSDINLGDQATLHLPADMAYIPVKEATNLMALWGNEVGAGFYGLVIGTLKNSNWVMTVEHKAVGFVKDDDAKNWNADKLLQSIKDGTEEVNKRRIDQGLTALDVVGWIQDPKYDAAAHELVWSIKMTHRGEAAGEPAVVNFNTYALGRDGYFELDLLTDEQSVETDKLAAVKVISAVDYKAGKKYSDYVAGSDHTAEYGLAALVAGVAAKKLGILALGGLFFAKFAKLIFVGLAVAGGGVAKLFGRGKKDGGDSTQA